MKTILILLLLSTTMIHAEFLLPKDSRHDRAKYVSSLIKPGDVGAEIGVWKGTFAFYTLFQRQPSKLFLIDPWIRIERIETQEEKNQLYINVCTAFAPYQNVIILRMKSEEAASFFPDEFFDYVYVDGDHSYESVLRDLEKYFPKIKIGGLIIGDDYGWGNVSVAVQDFVEKHKEELLWFGNPLVPEREGQFVFQRLK